jgi:hypothetical protein
VKKKTKTPGRAVMSGGRSCVLGRTTFSRQQRSTARQRAVAGKRKKAIEQGGGGSFPFFPDHLEERSTFDLNRDLVGLPNATTL